MKHDRYVSRRGRLKTATIRELRTDLRSVKRKLEEHEEIVITDRGEPAYVIKRLPPTPHKATSLPDYYSRLLKRQPTSLSLQATRRFWGEERA